MSKLTVREKMLTSDDKSGDRIMIPPTIRNNDKLFIIDKLINKEFAGGI